MHLAARTLKPQHSALLLARGAKPNEIDQSGLSPLAVAISETLRAEWDSKKSRPEQAQPRSGSVTKSVEQPPKTSTAAPEPNPFAGPSERNVETGLATIAALIAGGCDVKAIDSKGNSIRESFSEALKHPDAPKASHDKDDIEARYLPPFILKPTSYRAPNGFDATRVTASPLVEKIASLLNH